MLNRAEIIGHLGNDPDMKYQQSGEAIATISVATTERWKDKSGQQQERTEWHRVTFFGRLAEIVGEYLKKGRLVYVAGRIQTDKYTDKDGIERYATKIIANEMKMLGGGEDRGSGGGQQSQGGRSQSAQSSRPASNASARQRQAPPTQQDGFSDEDIPFD